MEVERPSSLPCQYCHTIWPVEALETHFMNCPVRKEGRRRRKDLLSVFELPAELLNSFDETVPPQEDSLCDFVTVIDGTEIWLGGKHAPEDGRRRWDAICNCAEEIHLLPDVGACRTMLHLPAQDTVEYDLYVHFEEATAFLERELKNPSCDTILFLCAKGISRSSALLMAAIMATQQMSLRDTWLLVKKARPVAMPNPRFFSALRKWEHHLFPHRLESFPLDLLSLHPAVLL